MNLHLLVIDPQHDFCDPDGALCVPGAHHDMIRLAALLDRIGPRLTRLTVTLDSHHYHDIAHPSWWRDPDGAPPSPFTILTGAQIDDGIWRTTDPEASARSRAYVAALEQNGRYPLCVWPPHCLLGSPGHSVHAPLRDAIDRWSASGRWVRWEVKGLNPWTEHYSAIRADVPDPADPSTLPNPDLLSALADADRVLVAGEAGSHCVAHTLRDLAEHLGDSFLSRCVLLADAVSPVPGFEALQRAMLDELIPRGLATATTEEVLR